MTDVEGARPAMAAGRGRYRPPPEVAYRVFRSGAHPPIHARYEDLVNELRREWRSIAFSKYRAAIGEIEDLSQMAWVKLHAAVACRGSLREERAFYQFSRMTFVRVVLESFRIERLEPLEGDLSEGQGLDEEIDTIRRARASIEEIRAEEARLQERIAILRKTVAEIFSADEARLAELRWVEGRSPAAIGSERGSSSNAMRQRFKRLKKRLESQGVDVNGPPFCEPQVEAVPQARAKTSRRMS